MPRRLVKSPDLPAVEVTWADASSVSQWTSLANHRTLEPKTIRSVGMLSVKNRKIVQLVQSFSDDDDGEYQAADSLTIPATWVKRVRRLR